MTFTLTINTGNAAFGEVPDEELARILHVVAGRVREGYTDGRISDVNGEPVGSFELD